MVFHGSLSDNKSPQVSRTLLSIQTDLNNSVGWKVLIQPQIFYSSSPLTKPLGIIGSTPFSIDITITIILFAGMVQVLVSSFAFFDFALCGSLGRQRSLYGKYSYFFLISFIYLPAHWVSG